MTFTTLLLLCFQFLATVIYGGPCYEGWFYNNGACYGYGETPASWVEAETACNLFKATLVEIGTSAENDFVKMILKNKQVSKAWVGGTDMFDEANWTWLTNKQRIYPFSDWQAGQPSDAPAGGEDCLNLVAAYSYRWGDDACSLQLNFVCETHQLETIIG